ncbi:MAG: GMC family oxidoreductase [Hyphomonadaceae bacterium]
MAQTSFDYVIVGAGAAGCVMAARLSEDPAVRVALIEAGGGDGSPFLRIPGFGFLVGAAPKYNWGFVTEPMVGVDGRRMTLLAGKALGGSSSINGMIYTRGHSRDYDLWRQMGAEGWGFEGVLPFFRKAEGSARGASALRGGDGPFRTKKSEPRLPIADAFLEALTQAGFPLRDDLNADEGEGFGFYDVNIHRGRRMSAAASYLEAARVRPNLSVFTRAHALRVAIENGRARGVEILHLGVAERVSAEREVIVCAGAIKSPQLLMLSGVGPAEELAAQGLPVVVDSPNVGRNLQNHPCYRAQWLCNAPVTARRHLHPLSAAKAAWNYALHRSGPLAESFVTAGGFFRTDERMETPDAQVVMLAALVPDARPGKLNPWDLLPKEDGFSLTIYQGSPWSRGDVRLASADPLAAPRVQPNYFADPRDMDVLVRAMTMMRAVIRQPAIAKYVAREVRPGLAAVDDATLRADIRRNASTSYHQAGTCAMGVDETAVVDAALRVRGVDGLRVADASVIPRLPNAALHGPVIMIGEKAAALVKAA